MMNLFYRAVPLCVVVLLLSTFVFAQTGRDAAIALYKQGKNKEALVALEKASKNQKTDAEVWNFLGLAYVRNGDLKKAVKAFEKAIGFSPQNAIYRTNIAYTYLLSGKMNKAQAESTQAIEINPQSELGYYIRGAANVWEGDTSGAVSDADKAIAINPDYSPAYTLKSDALFAKFGNRVGSGAKLTDAISLLQEAKDVLETCLKNCRDNNQAEAAMQQERLETLKVFTDYFSKNANAILSQTSESSSNQTGGVTTVPPDPSITPLKILVKPRAEYTDKARQNGIQGTIRIVVLFANTGQVTQALILKGLGGGLNENAVKAVKKVKFEPAKKDGKPISQIKIVEYSFSIY